MIFSKRILHKKSRDWVVLISRRKQILNLGASSAVQIIISLIQMMVVVRICGLNEWKYQTLGVLVGALGGSLVDSGFSVASNGFLSKLDSVYYRQFYKNSLARRIRTFLLISFLSPIVSFLLFQSINCIFVIFMIAQASLALTSEWILIAIDELQYFSKVFTFPKLILSLIGLLLVWFSSSSIPIAVVILFFVAYSNRQISNFLKIQEKLKKEITKNEKIIFPKTNFALAKFIGDAYWVFPGIVMQLAGSPFLVNFLLWERITKFFIAPSMVASQAITGVLTARKITWKEGLVISIKNHVLISLLFSFSGYFVIRYAYIFLSHDSFLSEGSLIFSMIYISFVILNRSFVLHGFYFSNDKRTPLVANLLLLASYAMLFLPIFRKQLEYVLFYFAFFQFIIFIYFMFKSRIWRKTRYRNL